MPPRSRRTRLAALGLLGLVLAACSPPPSSSARSRWVAAPPTAAASPPPAAASPPTAAASPPAEAFTVAATGDLLIHGPVAERTRGYGTAAGAAYDFRPMLARVRPLLSAADLALCHLETPLAAGDTAISGYPTFNTPHELADAVADAGYDGCSTASNHALDKGEPGVRATLDALDRVGVEHAGTARSPAEAGRVELHQVRSAAIAHLSYTYGANGGVPTDRPWLVNVTEVGRVLADARRARSAGASFVIVSMHWGAEYQTAPTERQQEQARALLASPDVDLILGDHVHVLQPVQKIGDKYVVYGLGNLLSNQSARHGLPAGTQDGAIVTAHVRRDGDRLLVDRIAFTPTYVEIGPYTVWPVARALDDPSTPAGLHASLLASWRRTVAAESSVAGRPADAVPDQIPRQGG